MREPTRLRRLFGAGVASLALAALAALVAGPPALAQTEEPDVGDPTQEDPTQEDPTQDDPDDDEAEPNPAWTDSRFDEPLSSSPALIGNASFPISGRFVHTIYEVTEVRVDFGRRSGGVFSQANDDPCVPKDPRNPVAGPQQEGADGVDFSVSGVTWPCNGEFVIRAYAQAQGSVRGSSEHEMTVRVSLRAPAPPVTSLDATVEGDRVTISWDADDPSPDAAGYRVERAGPRTDGDFYGSFTDVGSVTKGTTSIEDEPPASGDYQYRVRALRDSGGDLDSPIHGTAVADVTIGSTSDSTPTSASTEDRGSRRSSTLGAPGSSRNPRLPSGPPTTLDTGFDSEIDYGDRSLDGQGELADEGGQSIIRTEGDGAGLLAPTAGALVLLGWAGHIVYLNRLAKQF